MIESLALALHPGDMPGSALGGWNRAGGAQLVNLNSSASSSPHQRPSVRQHSSDIIPKQNNRNDHRRGSGGHFGRSAERSSIVFCSTEVGKSSGKTKWGLDVRGGMAHRLSMIFTAILSHMLVRAQLLPRGSGMVRELRLARASRLVEAHRLVGADTVVRDFELL